MSEALREELARELGVDDIVRQQGWGAVSARDCGRLVQRAVLRAEALLAGRLANPSAPGAPISPSPVAASAGWTAGPDGFGRR